MCTNFCFATTDMHCSLRVEFYRLKGKEGVTLCLQRDKWERRNGNRVERRRIRSLQGSFWGPRLAGHSPAKVGPPVSFCSVPFFPPSSSSMLATSSIFCTRPGSTWPSCRTSTGSQPVTARRSQCAVSARGCHLSRLDTTQKTLP